MQIIVSQLGARQHYAVPRALLRLGALRTFYTDIWVRNSRSRLSRIGGAELSRVFGRYHRDLEGVDVRTTRCALVWKLLERLTGTLGGSLYDFHIRHGRQFSLKVNGHLSREELSPGQDVFFGFTGSSLETIRFLNEQGVSTVLDQVDAARVEERITDQERVRWPGWETDGRAIPQAYFERLAAEWELASIVLVNSDWTKQSLVGQDVEEQKIVVVPQAYEGQIRSAVRDYNGRRPLRVLWLGRVVLIKGIQYLMEAARILDNRVEIRVVGSIGICKEKVASCPPSTTFVGRVPRSEVEQYYKWADVFVLPTLSDGFAITQLEAMANGVPVITTPRCGNVVTDGLDGLIVPPCDAQALAESIQFLVDNPGMVGEMSSNCAKKVQQFTLDAYGKRLLRALRQFQNDQNEQSPCHSLRT